jgi:cell division septation protein DedD
MVIRFQCECGRTLRIEDEYAGRKGKCPACEAIVTIPEVTDAFESPSDLQKADEGEDKELGYEEVAREDAFTQEREMKNDESPIEGRPRGQKEKRRWFGSPKVLGLASALLVVLVVVVVITIVRQRAEPPAEIVVIEQITPLPEESGDTAPLPVGAKLEEEVSQKTLPTESMPAGEESTEEAMVDTPAIDEMETGQEVTEVIEDEKQEVASLEEKVEPIEKPVPVPGSYTIHVASFREKNRADQLVQELREGEFEAFHWEIDLPEKGKWYRVSVGNFPTQKHARRFVLERRLEENFEVFITKIPSS